MSLYGTIIIINYNLFVRTLLSCFTLYQPVELMVFCVTALFMLLQFNLMEDDISCYTFIAKVVIFHDLQYLWECL